MQRPEESVDPPRDGMAEQPKDRPVLHPDPTGLRPIHSLTREQLTALCAELGLPAFRARQLWHWLYQRLAGRWEDMHNLPRALRQTLSQSFTLEAVAPLRSSGAAGETRRVLLRLLDGETIEEVLIPADRRRTVCVSSQVGCRYRCAFCASGQAGLHRNLESGEIVGQVLVAARLEGERPSHVVFMGIGEPFDNYEEVLRAVRIINDAEGLCIGARRITISTCGLAPGIRRLSREGLQIELSVSLHAADDTLRSRLMPVNRLHPLDELLPACADYVEHTGRIITFEYVLIRGVNDSLEQAAELARRLSRFPCRVNLIPLSDVAEFTEQASTPERAEAFISLLARRGINATLRASKGASIKAACGQLRAAGGAGEAA